jgi:calcineurin-like phosphoesterase family protein
VFFTSDTHFGDHRVLNIARRPFTSVAEMNEALIARWNARVGPDDEVWHVGDFATAQAGPAIWPKLNGRKHLLVGNNDGPLVRALSWCSVQHYAELTVGGVRLVLCHYPFRTWNGAHRGAVNLHGHSHGRLKPLPRQFDVGVDCRDFSPVSLDQLLSSRST